MALLPHHFQKIKERGFADEQIQYLSTANGKPATLESLTADQIQADWLDAFPSMKANAGGALLLRFNDSTVSLKPDQPEWDEEHHRFKKYLYAVRKNGSEAGSNTQPWTPSKPPRIATEGLFDALACTALIGIPCAAATAPSHIRRSKFPTSAKTYINDADVPFHHSPSLLPVVVEQCRVKGLKIAHLPRNPDADYAYTGARIPEDCKWGMEEWARKWQADGLDPKAQLETVIAGALDPVNYLRQVCLEYREIGVWYPDNVAMLENFGKAIAAATGKPSKRRSLRDLLHECTGAPINWIDEQIKLKDPEHNPTAKEPSEWDLRIQAAKDSGEGDPIAEHDALNVLLNERASEVINSSRTIREQKSAIKALANSLGFRPDNNFVTALYEQLDNTAAAYEPDVEPGQVFTAQAQSWLLFEIFINGLNLLVGMPGAGKSRLLVALIRAHLHDQPTFIGRKLQPGSTQKVLLVGTDQDRQQWGALLAEQQLATEISRSVDDNGIEHIEYRLHPSVYPKTSGGCFMLDADGLRWIRNWCKDNPSGLLIIDSLSAVLPQGIKEADEAAGRLMRQIEVARQTCPCIVTHHSKKESASSGELGVYSGSGHGSIDRAVSRFIGLGYETHKEHGVEKLHEDSPRRILTSQKRGAGNQRLILENGDHNTWELIGTAAEVREAQREDIDDDPTAKFTGWRKDIWIAVTNDWQSTADITAALPEDRRKKKNAKKIVREHLNAFKEMGLIQHRPAGWQEDAQWKKQVTPV